MQFVMQCGHTFCNNCWLGHVRVQLENGRALGKIFVIFPEGNNIAVGDILPNSQSRGCIYNILGPFKRRRQNKSRKRIKIRLGAKMRLTYDASLTYKMRVGVKLASYVSYVFCRV